ncbi:hypothetical protein AYO41_04235 [Verrucomicrobia bacterium SCGC AG-212-E04]|nr:hypothetical protein AYO41_04235 [Verrucomicrobia bacterium SCGC AG-212-E04]
MPGPKRLLRFAIAALLVAAVALTVLVASVQIPPALLQSAPGETLTLRDARGGALAEIANDTARSQHPRPLAQLGNDLPRVTIALEDHRFDAHGGVDWRAVAGAAWRNLRNLRAVSGASTITQQLVKDALGRPPRTVANKFREAAIAWKLERRWSKAQTLERYLNTVNYGNRLLGAEAAARAYFDKAAASLDLGEAIYLAGLPQAPGRFNPWRHPAAAEYKFQRSIRRLARLGVISNEELRALSATPPKPGRFLPARRAPHFVDAVLARAKADGVPFNGDWRTTIEPELQTMAEAMLARHLESLGRHDTTQAALVVIENESGAVRALVGSRNYFAAEGQNNGALRLRSAGSALKPFIYATAIDRRVITAATILPDLPGGVRTLYADYDPQNYTGRYLGPVRARLALGNSLNVPAVHVLDRLGARQGFFELQRWGLHPARPYDDYGAGFILGNAEVRPLDLASAYAALARGGLAAERAQFLGRDDRPHLERVASAAACAIVTDILCDDSARRRTFGADSPLDVPVRVAVKTGTSSGFRDGWCAGFTGRHTVLVWSGNFDGRPMGELLSVRSAAPLWRMMIDYLLVARHDPPVPETLAAAPGLVAVKICPLTGLLPAAIGPESPVTEYFLPGTTPREDAANSFVADPRGGSPRLLLPPEYAAWCRSVQNGINAVARSPDGLAITSPADGANFFVDPNLSPTQQMIELSTNAPNPAAVRWSANGQPLSTDPVGRTFWKLARGEWEIRAEDGNATAITHVAVE